VTVARDVAGLERKPRAVAIGTFDGVHRGHRRVLERAVAANGTATAVTFDPHPRSVLGNHVELIVPVERRVELLLAAGMKDVLVLEFTLELSRAEPEAFAEQTLRAIGAETIVAGSNFRFGSGRTGDLALLRALGFDVDAVPLVEGTSSSEIRRLIAAGEIERAADALGRPPELDGVVVSGDARGGTLGFPTANLRIEPGVLVPAYGIYAGFGGDTRAAISVGTNPHYGGTERRIEAFLLDFEGDLYGQRLTLELWRRLRDERAFASEADLVEQIAKDVAETRSASRPE
jgi:riboflavin kinase/FMN adenylyltransferase